MTINILIVEDEFVIALDLQKRLLSFGYIANEIVSNGTDALAYLHGTGNYQDAKRPHLVLLDWHLPGISGQDVLGAIKSDRKLNTIPVCVMTNSNSPCDMESAYALHANCFVNKPVDVREFISVVRSIENFWLTVVKLPAR